MLHPAIPTSASSNDVPSAPDPAGAAVGLLKQLHSRYGKRELDGRVNRGFIWYTPTLWPNSIHSKTLPPLCSFDVQTRTIISTDYDHII